jgi:hypothetical protein
MHRRTRGNRTRVTVNCTADAYAAPGERIVEFKDDTADKGGLISFRRTDDGRLMVDVYRTDPGVVVRLAALADLATACRELLDSLRRVAALTGGHMRDDSARCERAEVAIRAATGE